MTPKDIKDLYVVFYEIIGSRLNGMYLVKAANKRAARKSVVNLDRNYVVRGTGAVLAVEDYIYDILGVTKKKILASTKDIQKAIAEQVDEELEMFLDGVKLPRRNEAYHMEEGT
jgi:hypothetical protein